MKTIGFLISHKNGEGRRALLPEHIGKIKNADKLYFETGYGEAVGVSDEEYGNPIDRRAVKVPAAAILLRASRLLRAISSPTLSSATQTISTR